MNIQDINFQPLFTWINKQLNSNVEFSINFEGKRPEINCPNLFHKSGIFQSVIKEVEVGFFNSSFNQLTGELWVCVTLSYESWDGGSNGMYIGHAWFNPESGWTFESKREKG